MKCEFQPSLHVKDQMIVRGISKKEIMDCILKGVKKLQGKKIVGTFGQVETVFLKKPCHYFVVTAYWR